MITVIDLVCRLVLMSVYTLSGMTKLQDLAGTRQAIKAFGVQNKKLISFCAFFLPITELSIVALMPFVHTACWGGIISVALLLLFIILIMNLIQKGESINCHCFGQSHVSPTGFNTIVRNMGLLVLSLVIVLQGGNEMSLWQFFYFTQEQWIMFLGTFFVIMQAVFLVLFMDKNELLKKRIESLETEVFKGLPIGTKAPDFELTNEQGAITTLSDLLLFKKPLLFLFFDPDCGPCQILIPKALVWNKEHAARFKIVFIGRIGKQNAIFESAQGVILLHPTDRNLAQNIYKTRGFPSAIVVSAKGFIDSFPGAGEEGIKKLVKILSPIVNS